MTPWSPVQPESSLQPMDKRVGRDCRFFLFSSSFFFFLSFLFFETRFHCGPSRPGIYRVEQAGLELWASQVLRLRRESPCPLCSCSYDLSSLPSFPLFILRLSLGQLSWSISNSRAQMRLSPLSPFRVAGSTGVTHCTESVRLL